MITFEQLNIYGLANLKSKETQHVHLFAHEELKAQLVVLPPETNEEWHTHAGCDEVLDVIQGEGQFCIEGREFRGGPGKSVLVRAGTPHRLVNCSSEVWLVRSTQRERLSPRHTLRLFRRAIRERLGLER